MAMQVTVGGNVLKKNKDEGSQSFAQRVAAARKAEAAKPETVMVGGKDYTPDQANEIVSPSKVQSKSTEAGQAIRSGGYVSLADKQRLGIAQPVAQPAAQPSSQIQDAQNKAEQLVNTYNQSGTAGLKRDITKIYPRKDGETVEAYRRRVNALSDAAKKRASKGTSVTPSPLVTAQEKANQTPTAADFTDSEGNVDYQAYSNSLENQIAGIGKTEQDEITQARIEDQDITEGLNLGVSTEEEIKGGADYQEEEQFQDDQMNALAESFRIQRELQEKRAEQEESEAEEAMKTREEQIADEIADAKVGGYSDNLIRAIQTEGKEDIKEMEKRLDYMRDSNDLTLAKIMNDSESLKSKQQFEAATYLDNYVSKVQSQQLTQNQKVYEQSWEQYKFQQEQNWNQLQFAADRPELFNIETINGEVRATAKSPTEIQTANIAAQWGKSLDEITQIRDTFGEDSTVGQALIANTLSQYGYNVDPGLLFPESQNSLEERLSLIQQFSDLPPQAIQELAMGGQILGGELNEQERATLQVLARNMGQQQIDQEYTTVKSGNQIYSFDKNTGKLQLLAGGDDIQNLGLPNQIVERSKISESSLVDTTIENGMYVYGDAADRAMSVQCGGYVNDVTGQKIMGDSYQSKIKNVPVDENSPTGYNMTPTAGGYFVMDVGTEYGHTGMVKGVDDKGIYVTDYNWGVDGDGNPIPGQSRSDRYIAFDSPEFSYIRGFGAVGLESSEQIKGGLTGVMRGLRGESTFEAQKPQTFQEVATQLPEDIQNIVDSSEKILDVEKSLGLLGYEDGSPQAAAAIKAFNSKKVVEIAKESEAQPTPEEEMIIADIAPIHPLWQGSKTSDKDMAIISKDILSKTRAGGSVDDILIGNLSEKGLKNKDVAKNLLTYASGLDEYNNKRGIQLPINMGKPTQAMVNVENALLNDIDAQLKDTRVNQSLVERSNKVLGLLNIVPSDKLGAYDALQNKFERVAGLNDSETELAQELDTAMTLLYNDIRKQSLGSAITPTELEFLNPLLSSLQDQPGIIRTKVEGLKSDTINQYNIYRSQKNLPDVNENQLLNKDKRLELYKKSESEMIQEDIDDTRAVNPNLPDDELGKLLKQKYPNANIEQFF